MNKKLLCALALVAALVLTGAGCAKKAVTPAEKGAPAGGAPAAEQPAPAKKGDTGKMTGDLWVELTAQYNYHLGKMDTDWFVEGGDWEKLLKEKGVTQEQYTVYNDKISTDPKYLELAKKLADRLKELMSK